MAKVRWAQGRYGWLGGQVLPPDPAAGSLGEPDLSAGPGHARAFFPAAAR